MGEEFWAIPKHIANDENLSLPAKIVYGVLFTRKNGQNEAWPSQKNIAESFGMSVRTVKRAVKDLVDKGLISSEQRGLRKSNMYALKCQRVTSRRVKSGTSGSDKMALPIGKEQIEKNKGIKKSKKEKTTDELWTEMIEPYMSKYAPSLIAAFTDYHRAKNHRGKKERWQMKKVFDMGRSLATWKRNDDKWQHEKEQRSRARMEEDKRPERSVTGFQSIGSILT